MLYSKSVWIILLILILPITGSLQLEEREIYEQVETVTEIPVLMYHVIADHQGPLQELYVSPEVFQKQMDYLAEQGYHTITLQELSTHWQETTPLPSKPIIITFDDGYRSVYTQAYPAMKKHQFRGVLFLYVQKFTYKNSITKGELSELIKAGYELGNHSYTHTDLRKVDEARLNKEINTAKARLEEMFGVSVTSFAYPGGVYNEKVLEVVESSGHTLAVTTRYGYSNQQQGVMKLRRIRINRSDGLSGFKYKLKKYETEMKETSVE